MAPLTVTESTAFSLLAQAAWQRHAGLVSKRIFEQAPRGRVYVLPGGLDIQTHRQGAPFNGGGKRGVIRGFSQASRRRFKRLQMRVLMPPGGASLIDLTYHLSAGDAPQVWHAHLHRFLQELERHWAQFSPEWEWVLEFQKRGAPHFHVVAFWRRAPHPIQFRRWVAREWHRIAEPSSDAHAKAGTRCDHIPPDDALRLRKQLGYLQKYLGKAEQKHRTDRDTGDDLPTGRMWGDNLDQTVTEGTELLLDSRELPRLLRRIRRWGKHSSYLREMGRRGSGGLVYGDGLTLAQLLRGLHPREQINSLALAMAESPHAN